MSQHAEDLRGQHDLVLPISAEELVVTKRPTSERVTVSRETRSRDVVIDELLACQSVVVERVPIGRYVDVAPEIRQDGDDTILPVVEEVAVVVRRLLLREEVRLRRVKTQAHHVETVTLREQHVVVSRTAAAVGTGPEPVLNRAPDSPALVYDMPIHQNQTRSTLMNDETIVAVFNTAAQADAAAADLKAAHVPDSAISRHADDGNYETTGTATSGTTAAPSRQQGFWASLFGGASSDEPVYDRSLASGGTVLVVKTPMDDADAVVAILERHNPIDLDERVEGDGLSTPTAATTTMAGMAGTTADPGMTGMTGTGTTSGVTGTTPAASYADADRVGAAASEGGVLPLAEESLSVGKRLVNRGGTRIRRYVVERPAEADVSLRNETIQVDRRPVAAGDAAAADFTDKSIEMTASGEEAVVGKTARVVEEVALRKQATERTETVHDTVRRQDVEVEQTAATDTAVPASGPVTPR